MLAKYDVQSVSSIFKMMLHFSVIYVYGFFYRELLVKLRLLLYSLLAPERLNGFKKNIQTGLKWKSCLNW